MCVWYVYVVCVCACVAVSATRRHNTEDRSSNRLDYLLLSPLIRQQASRCPVWPHTQCRNRLKNRRADSYGSHEVKLAALGVTTGTGDKWLAGGPFFFFLSSQIPSQARQFTVFERVGRHSPGLHDGEDFPVL